MNGGNPRRMRPRASLQIALLLLFLTVFGIFAGVAMGAVIAANLNRRPTITAYVTPVPEQQTATATAFQKQFRDQVYKRITELAQTRTTPTRRP
jgi:hypothetical protein